MTPRLFFDLMAFMVGEHFHKGFLILELPLGRSATAGFFYRVADVPESWTRRDFETLELAKDAIDKCGALL